MFVTPEPPKVVLDEPPGMCEYTEVVVNPHPFGTEDDPYREDLHGDVECSCVRFARSQGAELPYGVDAKDLVPNSEPEVGGVIILQYKETHVAYIEEISEEGYHIREGNYRPCEITERVIPVDDHRIVGFWKA